MHHIINMDKARRPSLPSVFEKAAHPSQSIKSALGMSPSNATFGKMRSQSSSHGDGLPNDPYHLGRSSRSTSKTSLSSVFRPNHTRDRDLRSEPTSQLISPAASSFFTADDELEMAERAAFLRTDKEASSGEETFQQPRQYLFKEPYPPGRRPLERRASAEGINGRSRAGSGSSATTAGSGRSISARGFHTPSNNGYTPCAFPVTAPPTQSTFFPAESSNTISDLASLPQSVSRPTLSPLSSSDSIIIPQPIPPPPSSSTQPFFTKAAISAAHYNATLSRPGFYRPRKSSQLSTSASTMTGYGGSFTQLPELEQAATPSQQSRDDDAQYGNEVNGSNDNDDDDVPSTGPSVIIRRPTVRSSSSDGSSSLPIRRRSPSSPASSGLTDGPVSSLPISPLTLSRSSTSTTTAPTIRHFRASSDGTGTLRTSPSEVVENSSVDFRQRSLGHKPSSAGSAPGSEQDMDPETVRESQDTFPTDQERPFLTRPRAGSRARVDSFGTNTGSTANGTSHTSPNLQPSTAFALAQPHSSHMHDMEASWSGLSRPSRSGSTGTDTRTSRSGSTGEAPGHSKPHFFGFDYSSSPGKL